MSLVWFWLKLTEYYFQTWNKKEHNVIINRVISSHVGPMYLETSYISLGQIRHLSNFMAAQYKMPGFLLSKFDNSNCSRIQQERIWLYPTRDTVVVLKAFFIYFYFLMNFC